MAVLVFVFTFLSYPSHSPYSSHTTVVHRSPAEKRCFGEMDADSSQMVSVELVALQPLPHSLLGNTWLRSLVQKKARALVTAAEAEGAEPGEC